MAQNKLQKPTRSESIDSLTLAQYKLEPNCCGPMANFFHKQIIATNHFLILCLARNNLLNLKDLMIKIFAILILTLSIGIDLLACTGIRLRALNNSIVYGRTLEFAENLNSEILFIPRNYKFTATGPTGEQNGLTWKTKYAALGANALHIEHIIDGVNELGLAGGLFYFPDYAQYQFVSKRNAHTSLASWELLTWILTQFSSITEVKNAIQKIKVSQVGLPQFNGIQPLHAILHDAHGNCMVIEYIAGKLHLYDNSLGVLTNSPSFDWHVTNLRNYIHLSAFNVPKIKLANITLAPLGQGSGLLGLPGDFTPPSRFVRAVAFSQSAEPALTEQDAITTAFHVLDLFNIPKGIVRQSHASKASDYTQWTSLCDIKNKSFYFHTYNNRQIRRVDLLPLAESNKKIIKIPMVTPQQIVNITPKN